jgi:hypothetical protein
LVAEDWATETLKTIGLTLHETVPVRFHRGSIKGFDRTPDELQIAIYNREETRGWLFLAIQEKDGKISPIQNAYQLMRIQNRWEADEGNGGIATYKYMSRFATGLFDTQEYRITLNPYAIRWSDRCTDHYKIGPG